MKNRKGFTLIELLAVIIILAILMLIAVPAVLNTLNTAKQNAFKTQAQSIWKAAEQQYIIDSMGTGGQTCYDHTDTNLTTGGAATLTFQVTLDSTGKATGISIADTSQGLKATGTAASNITVSDQSVTAVSACS